MALLGAQQAEIATSKKQQHMNNDITKETSRFYNGIFKKSDN
jgi:hypothetical protein